MGIGPDFGTQNNCPEFTKIQAWARGLQAVPAPGHHCRHVVSLVKACLRPQPTTHAFHMICCHAVLIAASLSVHRGGAIGAAVILSFSSARDIS